MFDNFARMFSTKDGQSDEESGDEPDEETESQQGDSRAAADTDGATAGLDGNGGDPDGRTDGPDAADLTVRLSELEDDIDSTESSLRSLESSQQEITDSVEEMNETVRRLTGMYDRIAAQENPFVDESDDGNGVVGEQPVDPSLPDPDGGNAEPESSPDQPHGDGRGDSSDEAVISFGDLQGNGEIEDQATETETHNLARTAEESAAAGPDPDPDSASSPHNSEDDPATALDGRAPLLETVPDGYAGEILLMEWLAALMDQSGPAGTLRAIEHYQDVGWISSDTADRLIDVIGGPALDVFVDPRTPRELSAEEHADSYGYIRVIRQLREL